MLVKERAVHYRVYWRREKAIASVRRIAFLQNVPPTKRACASSSSRWEFLMPPDLQEQTNISGPRVAATSMSVSVPLTGIFHCTSSYCCFYTHSESYCKINNKIVGQKSRATSAAANAMIFVPPVRFKKISFGE